MVNMPNVLGMRLEDALAECRAQGVEPEIVMTLPPKGREQGTIRVIRAKEGVLTTSGDIDVELPDDTGINNIDVHSRSGDISMRRSGRRGSRTVTGSIRSVSGDIEIR